MDQSLHVLRTGCQWKMMPKEYGSGSTCHRRFQEWTVSKVFQRLWVRLLEGFMMTSEALDGNRHLKLLDSISVKAPLEGGHL